MAIDGPPPPRFLIFGVVSTGTSSRVMQIGEHRSGLPRWLGHGRGDRVEADGRGPRGQGLPSCRDATEPRL